VLVGLAAKNAILIVEFAKQGEDEGKTRFEAAVLAARTRACLQSYRGDNDIDRVYHSGEACGGLFVTVAMRRNALILQKKFSTKWRHLYFSLS